MMRMTVPYEATGRRDQKARTRDALVEATRRLLNAGTSPAVEAAAAAARVSRTTAYRYFPNQRALLTAALPEIGRRSLLPDPAPADVEARVELTVRAAIRFTLDWEPMLRASLRLSLDPGAEQPPLRGGRAIGWLEEALEPLEMSRPDVDRHRLAVAIRSATGIESLVWLTDIAGLSRDEAAELMLESSHALLGAALDERAGTRPGLA